MNETNLALNDLAQKVGKLEVENSVLRAQLSIANMKLQRLDTPDVSGDEDEPSATDN